VLSMKASNTRVMIQAYRLLINKMEEEGMNYPLHLGVTEAGDGADGRIKSAVGIGAMLEDGIGDTVRVSLTEAPEAECPVAIDLVKRYTKRHLHLPLPSIKKVVKNPFIYERRKTQEIEKIGGDNVPIVIADFSKEEIKNYAQFVEIGYMYSADLDKWHIADQAADFVLLGNQKLSFEIPGTLQCIYEASYWKTLNNKTGSFPIFNIASYIVAKEKSDRLNFVRANISSLDDINLSYLKSDQTVVLVLEGSNLHQMPEMRSVFFKLLSHKLNMPVIIQSDYKVHNKEETLLYASTDLGGLLIDGLGDGVLLNTTFGHTFNTATAFGILQATRTRISKTEYISCPSCGRTLFDLEETTAMIRKRTHHLKGVKIGIMGCIVNGPGEMADADYGYVGSGIGKITLYRGQEVVQRNIPSENAVDALIDIIREDDNWVEMENTVL